ncbi:hypothetical protein ACOZ4I_08015 [Haloarcula salina]|uniref:hypothetical protein n=1 Tax=Haloarcula salina TaxID=1429914 RepID=UPI003C6EF950
MQGGLAALDPHKAVLPIIALIGLVPVLLRYRRSSRLFVVGYMLLIVATVVTNVENLFLPTVLNYIEHYFGLMGAGLAFLFAAYIRRKQVVGNDDEEDPEAAATSGPEVAADGGRAET